VSSFDWHIVPTRYPNTYSFASLRIKPPPPASTLLPFAVMAQESRRARLACSPTTRLQRPSD
jgi:hypothetical protein